MLWFGLLAPVGTPQSGWIAEIDAAENARLKMRPRRRPRSPIFGLEAQPLRARKSSVPSMSEQVQESVGRRSRARPASKLG